MARPVHEVGQILAVEDGELRIEAEPLSIFAQEASAEAVERPGISRPRGLSRLWLEAPGKQALDPAAELGRRAAREGGEYDAPGVGAGEDQPGHPVASIAVFPEPAPAMTSSGPGPPKSPIHARRRAAVRG